MTKGLTLLVDTSSLAYRALFSNPDSIVAPDGTPINAAFGFLGMLARLIRDHNPSLGNRIGRITTSGVITEYPLPRAGSDPVGIAAGPDGALWFAEYGGNGIGRITTSGDLTELRVAQTNGYPYGITAGPHGALWFTESYGNEIGAVRAHPLQQ